MADPRFLFDGPEDAPVGLLLAHGAGAPMDSPFMAHIARGLGARGLRIARFEFPYMAARRADGKKRPPDRARQARRSRELPALPCHPHRLVPGRRSQSGPAQEFRAHGRAELGPGGRRHRRVLGRPGAMTADETFPARVTRLLLPLGPVRARAMFGGHGIFHDDLMFALIAWDRLYFKVDGETKERFAAAGGEPFVYQGKHKPVEMSYWALPGDGIGDPAEIVDWAGLALAAARRARTKKPRKRKA